MHILPVRNAYNGGYKFISKQSKKIMNQKAVKTVFQKTKSVLIPETPKALKAHLILNASIIFSSFFLAYKSITSVQSDSVYNKSREFEDGPIMKRLKRYPGYDPQFTVKELIEMNKEFVKSIDKDIIIENEQFVNSKEEDLYY